MPEWTNCGWACGPSGFRRFEGRRDRSISLSGSNWREWAGLFRTADMRPVYLLLEETSRELRARIAVAAALAARGVVSVLIPQWTAWYSLRSLPPGVMLFKGYNSAQTKSMAAAKRFGHVIAAIDEEALSVATEAELSRTLADDAAEVCDCVLAQGPTQASMIRNRFSAKGPSVTITGNPRIDFLRPPLSGPNLERGRAIRDARGDYLLVNANFAGANPRSEDSLGYYDLCVRVGVVNPADKADIEAFHEWMRWDHENLVAMVATLRLLSRRNPDRRIVLRPHPSESSDTWARGAAGVPNIDVIRDGDHIPWTAGARVMLHASCTTGLEAFLLETPTVGLVREASGWNRHFVSNELCLPAATPEAAADLVDAVWDRSMMAEDDREARMNALSRHLCLPSSGSCAEKVASALSSLIPGMPGALGDRKTIDFSRVGRFTASGVKIAAGDLERATVERELDVISRALGFSGGRVLEPVPGIVVVEPR